MATASDVLSKEEREKFEEHLKCPVCFEFFETPRALSCLHTFCDDCLTSHLINCSQRSDQRIDSIECPICRDQTPFRNNNTPLKDVSKSLPVNYTLLPLIEALRKGTQSDKEEQLCSSCEEVLTDYSSFCHDCKGCLCGGCAALHKKIKPLKKHDVTSFEKHGPPKYCQKHTEKVLEFLCESHNELVCSTCAVTLHRTCGHVAELEEDTIKDTVEDRCSKARLQLVALQNTVTVVLNQLLDRVEKLNENSRSVSSMYESVKEHLEVLHCNFKRSVDENNEVETQRITRCQNLMKKIENILKMLDVCQMSKTKGSLLYILLNISNQVNLTEVEVSELKQHEGSDSKKAKLARSAEQILELESLTTETEEEQEAFESISMSSDDLSSRDADTDTKGGAEKLPKDVTVEQDKWVNINATARPGPPWYISMRDIGDGLLLAVDWDNNKLVILDYDTGMIQTQMPFQKCISECIFLPDKQLFATFMYVSIIQKVSVDLGTDVPKLVLGNEIDIGIIPEIIASFKNEVVVGSSGKLYTFDMNGRPLKEFVFDLGYRLAQRKNQLVINENNGLMYITSQVANTLTVLNYNNMKTILFFNVIPVDTPTSMDFDRENNLYVCSEENKSVFVYTRYGSLLKIIPVDCETPTTLCFNKRRNKFWVANQGQTRFLKRFAVKDIIF